MPKTKEQVLRVIATRYSESQLMKAQEIIKDLREELLLTSDSYEARTCLTIIRVLEEAINI